MLQEQVMTLAATGQSYAVRIMSTAGGDAWMVAGPLTPTDVEKAREDDAYLASLIDANKEESYDKGEWFVQALYEESNGG